MGDLAFINQLIELGDRDGARKEILTLLRSDPQNIDGWLILAQVEEDRFHQMDCYRQALRIDPTNLAAQEGLRKLAQTPPTTSSSVSLPAQLNGTDQTAPEIPRGLLKIEIAELKKQIDRAKKTLLGGRINIALFVFVGLIFLWMGFQFGMILTRSLYINLNLVIILVLAAPSILIFILTGLYYLIYYRSKSKSIRLQLPDMESDLFGKELQLQRLKDEAKNPVSSKQSAL